MKLHFDPNQQFQHDAINSIKREIYKSGYIINGIDVSENLIELSNGETVFVGDTFGGLSKGLIPFDAEEVHNGYFSADKKGKWKDTKGNTIADDDTFKLIMENKEKLLDTNEPLRFIFSHSALREGWDNPNVFQICTLNETQSELKKRQEIGRGLRLSVNQEGIRIQDTSINRLTVVANESYEDFAKECESRDDIEFYFKLPFGHYTQNFCSTPFPQKRI